MAKSEFDSRHEALQTTGENNDSCNAGQWSELLQRHIAIIEEHTRFIDAIRADLGPQSTRYDAVTVMHNQCHEMLRMSQIAAKDWVPDLHAPSKDAASLLSSISQVSAPGNQTNGVTGPLKEQALKDKDGQHLTKHPSLKPSSGLVTPDILQASLAASEQSATMNGNGPHTSRAGAVQQKVVLAQSSANAISTQHNSETSTAPPLFVIDTKPTPVALDFLSYGPVLSEGKRSKRRKLGHSDPAASTVTPLGMPMDDPEVKLATPVPETTVIEHEDIDAEVDRRLAAKEARRKHADKKKRKRSSGQDETSKPSSSSQPATTTSKTTATTTSETAAATQETTDPTDAVPAVATPAPKRRRKGSKSSGEVGMENTTKHKRHSQNSAQGNERPHKKRRKDTSSDK